MGTARNTAIFRERDDSKGYATAKGIDALYSSGPDFWDIDVTKGV